MERRPLLCVSGLGRCGSSLVMQMLKAGGLRVPGEYPFYEVDLRGIDWSQYDAVKWMADQMHLVDPPRPRKVLWLKREVADQLFSIAKIANWAGAPWPRALDGAMNHISQCSALEQEADDVMWFEDLVGNPESSVWSIAEWACIPLSRRMDMLRCVYHRARDVETDIPKFELDALPKMLAIQRSMQL